MQVSERLRELVCSAKRVAVLTGAGISAESGVPTFRGEDGLWKKFRPEELATVEAFMRNPELVWEWYTYRRELMSKIEPNPGHYALAEMQKLFPEFTLITQNIDGLHHRAGSEGIIELHGNIQRNRCMKCSRHYGEVEVSEAQKVPLCECGGYIRPDVVWFGEMLPPEALERAFQVSRCSELFFSIGTSAVVQPAASLPLVAKESGAYVVEINVERTEIAYLLDESLLGKSGEVLPRVLEEIKTARG
jgi:NAD-dependent deacetylase